MLTNQFKVFISSVLNSLILFQNLISIILELTSSQKLSQPSSVLIHSNSILQVSVSFKTFQTKVQLISLHLIVDISKLFWKSRLEAPVQLVQSIE
ncbi:MAG: hypothetical protein Q8S84_07655 [bacterium]|nr:hypothetical protein [bacterium]